MRRHLVQLSFAAAVVSAVTSCGPLPKDLQYAGEFVDVLRRGGIIDQGVYRWSHNPFKFDVRQAATIWTNLGVSRSSCSTIRRLRRESR